MIYNGVVVSRYQPPPEHLRAFRGRVGIARKPAQVRVRFGNWEETRTATFEEPDGKHLAVGTHVAVSGPADLSRGGSCRLVGELQDERES